MTYFVEWNDVANGKDPTFFTFKNKTVTELIVHIIQVEQHVSVKCYKNQFTVILSVYCQQNLFGPFILQVTNSYQ